MDVFIKMKIQKLVRWIGNSNFSESFRCFFCLSLVVCNSFVTRERTCRGCHTPYSSYNTYMRQYIYILLALRYSTLKLSPSFIYILKHTTLRPKHVRNTRYSRVQFEFERVCALYSTHFINIYVTRSYICIHMYFFFFNNKVWKDTQTIENWEVILNISVHYLFNIK